MIHGAAALTQIQHGGKCAGNIILRSLHRGFQIVSLCQIGGDGAGEGTSGAVGIGVVDPLAVEPSHFFTGVQQIVCVVDVMTALQEGPVERA